MLDMLAAMLPPDTIYVATHSAAPPATNWAQQILSAIGIGLGGWALGRSVKHGEDIRHLVTFTGADGKNGMAEAFAEMKKTLNTILEVSQENRADLEMLKERSLHNRGD